MVRKLFLAVGVLCGICAFADEVTWYYGAEEGSFLINAQELARLLGEVDRTELGNRLVPTERVPGRIYSSARAHKHALEGFLKDLKLPPDKLAKVKVLSCLVFVDETSPRNTYDPSNGARDISVHLRFQAMFPERTPFFREKVLNTRLVITVENALLFTDVVKPEDVRFLNCEGLPEELGFCLPEPKVVLEPNLAARVKEHADVYAEQGVRVDHADATIAELQLEVENHYRLPRLGRPVTGKRRMRIAQKADATALLGRIPHGMAALATCLQALIDAQNPGYDEREWRRNGQIVVPTPPSERQLLLPFSE